MRIGPFLVTVFSAFACGITIAWHEWFWVAFCAIGTLAGIGAVYLNAVPDSPPLPRDQSK